MDQISGVCKRLLFPIILFLASSTIALGQTVTYTIGNSAHGNANPLTLSQTNIFVTFAGAGGATGLQFNGAPNLALWTVRVNGTVVPVTAAVAAGFIAVITFDATAIAGHGAGRPYLMPGETLTIAYAGGVGAGRLQVLNPAPTANYAPAFAADTSLNATTFACGDLIFSSQADYGPVDRCVPVVMNFHQFQYKLSLRFRNSSNFVLARVFYQYTWGDGTPAQNLNPYVSDLLGNVNAAFIDNTGFTGSNPAIVLTSRPVYNFPATTTPAPDICSWNTTVLPFYQAVGFCPAVSTTNLFANYDTDNANSGTLAMPFNPPGAGETSDRVCLGTNVNMRFIDQTLLNCRLAAPEATLPNDLARNIRISYGTTNYGAPGNIPDIRVTVPAVLGGATTAVTMNNAGGTLIFPAGFTPVSVGTADFNGVVTLAQPVTVATALTYMGRITTTLTNNQVVGQRFYIRMDYWDICNPYNSLTPNNPAPVSIQNYVEIITKPTPLTTAGASVCFGAGTPVQFSVGGVVAGVTAIRFYNKNPLGPGPIVNMQSSASTNFSSSNYTAANSAVGGNFTTANANGGYYSVWATQRIGAGGCESSPVEVVVVQQPSLTGNLPATPTGPIQICNGPPGTTGTYNESLVPPTKTIAANTFSNLLPSPPLQGAVNLTTEIFWTQSFGAGVSLSTSTGPATVATFNLAVQPPTFTAGNISAALRYQAQNIAVPASPNGVPNNVPGYNIAAQQCNNGPVDLSVSVYGQTVGGAVTPDRTICDLLNTGVMTLAGHRGSIVRWERTVNAGAPVVIANTTTTYSENVAFGPGTYRYYAVVQNASGGPCAVVNSTASTITVNPVPPVPTLSLGPGSTGGFTICQDGVQQVVLQSSNVGGAGVRFDFYRGAALVQSTASQLYTINTVAQSGSYTVVVVGSAPSSCQTTSAARVVTVNPLPTVVSATGGGAVCGGSPAPDIIFTLSGTAPFSGTYTDGTLPHPLAVAAGTTFTISAPVVIGTYKVTALTDANSCVATAMAPTAAVTLGGTAPLFDSGPALSIASACDAGGATTDPTLNFSLDIGSANLVGVVLTYKVDGSANRTKTFNTNAAGDPTVAQTFSDAELNSTAPSPHTITIVSILTPLGCQTVFNIPLSFTVNPLPVLVTPQSKTICSGAAVNYEVLLTPANTPAGTRFNWPDPDGVGGPATAGVNIAADPVGKLHITDVLTNTTGANLNVTYVITPTSAAGCAGVAANIVITVNPEPVIVAGQTKTICSGAAVNKEILLSPLNLPAGTVFNWPDPDGGGGPATAGVNVPMGVAGTLHILDILTNTTGSPITVTYNITPRSGAGCTGAAQTVAITVNAAPVLVAGQAKTICSGAAVNYEILLTPANLPAGTLFNWADPDGGGPATAGINKPMGVAGTLHITDVLTNTTGLPVTTTYTIIPTSGAGCVGTSRTVAVTVNPEPALNNGQVKSICSGQAVNYEILLTPANLPAGTVFNWPAPVMSSGPPQGTNGVNVPMGAAGTKHIMDVLTNNTVTPFTATYTITPTSGLGCVGAAKTVVVTVNPLPVANPIGGQATVCKSLTNIILYQVTLNPGSTYTWNIPAQFEVFGGGGTNSPNFFVLLRFPTIDPGSAITVVETNAAGCSGPVNSMIIKVADAPGALTIIGDATVCTQQTGVVYNLPAGFNAGSTFTWTVTGATIVGPGSGTGLGLITVDFGLISPVNIQVTETSSSGCVGTPASMAVSLAAKPVITSSATSSVCSGGTPGLVFTASIPSNFDWKVTSITGAITGTNVGNTGSGQLSATFTGATALINTSGAVGSVSFDVTAKSTAFPFCQGTPQSVVLTINPEPVLVSPQTKTVCSSANVNYEIKLSPLNLPAGTIFNWPKPVMSDASNQGTAGVNVPSGAAGTLHITDVLLNTSASPITATYTISPTSGLGCTGTPRTVVITVNPEPILSSGLDATRCSDLSIGLTLATAAGSVAANNYNITARSFAPGLTPAGTNALVPSNGVPANYLANDTYNNVSNSALIATYTVVPVSGAGCLGASKIITLTINPEPVLSNLLDVTVCSGSISGINLNTNGISVAAATYIIVGKTVAGGLVGGGGNVAVPAVGVAANYLANDRYTNTGNTSLTVVYQVSPVSAAACQGNPPQPVTITVLPEPVISSSLNSSVCSRSTIGLTLNTNGTSIAAANYDITARTIDPGLTPGGSNGIVPAGAVTASYLNSDVFTNTGSSAQNVTYTVVPRSGAGCLGQSKVITITINPEPVMSNALDGTVCSDIATGLILNTNGTSVGAANYNITARSISGGLTASVGNVAVPSIPGVAANYLSNDIFNNVGAVPLTVTYTVVPVSSAGCLGNSKVVTITINPEPVVSTSLDVTKCSQLPIGLILNTNGSSVAAVTYDITAQVISGGLTAKPGNVSVPANGVAANYLANDAYTNAGAVQRTVTYTVVPNSGAGCAGNPRVITVTVDPEPIMSNTLDATVCSNIVTGLTLNTNGTSVGAANFSITAITVPGGLTAAGGNAVVPATNVVANYLANDKFSNVGALPLTVTYTVVPNSPSNCPGPAKVISITINPEPVVSGALDALVCSDLATNLILATNGSSVAAATYNITARTIGGGITPAVGNVTVPAPGVLDTYLANDVFTNTNSLPVNVTYTVVPVSAAGCIGTAKIITIVIEPEPVMSASLNGSKCSDLAIGLTLNTNGTSVAAASYNITNRTFPGGLILDPGNAAVPANAVLPGYLANDKYTNTGAASLNVTYTVVPVSAAGCSGNPLVITMTINPEPVVSTSLDATVCSDAIIGLTLNTNGTSVAAASYNITNQVVAAGLTPAVTNVVVPAAGAGPAYLNGHKFTNLTLTPLTVSYTVVPVSAGGCLGDAKIIIITVNPEPVLSGSLNLTQCSDVATGLTLATNGTSVAAQNYNITSITIAAGITAALGNGAVPVIGVNSGYLANDRFTNTGPNALTVVYAIVPVSSLGCSGDPVNVTVTINPEPVVATNLDKAVCSGVPTGLNLNTNGTSVPAANYNITNITVPGALSIPGVNAVVPAALQAAGYLANDRYVNTTASPLDVTYTVMPVSAAGCLGDAKIITLTINPEPVVANGLDATICSDVAIGLTLNTNGSSVGAATYNITAQTIDPSLTAAGTNVLAPANGVAANYLAGDKFTNTGTLPKNVVFRVVPVSAAGCAGAFKDITYIINPEPVTSNALDATVCSDAVTGLTLNTNGSSVAAANYNIVSRTPAAGLVANGANVVVPAPGVAANYLAGDIFTNTGASSLTVTYVVVPVSAAGCLGDPKTITTTIRPEPVIANGLDATKCSKIVTGLILTTNGTSVAAATYNVTVINVAAGLTPAGTNAALANGVVANYLSADKFTNVGAIPLNVVYTVVPLSGAGCLGDPKNITITINPEPVVSTLLNATVCSDVNTNLTLNTNGTSVAATSYNVTGVVIAPALTAALSNATVPANGVAAGYLATDKFTNTTNASATVVYTVVATSGAGCVGVAQAITITISPEPVVAGGLDKSVCSDVTIALTLNTSATSVAAGSYNITSITVAPGLVANAGNAVVPASGIAANYLLNDIFTNTTSASLTVAYVVVPVSGTGCLGDPKTVTITIQPEPVVANGLDGTKCSNVATGLVLSTGGTSVAAANYNVTAISVAAGLTPVAGNAGVPGNGVAPNYLAADKFTNFGALPLNVVYTVVPVSAAGCLGDPKNITFIISPEPVVSTLLDATTCSDVATGLTLNTNGTSVAAVTYNITGAVVAPTLVPVAGNATVPANGVAANYLVADKYTNTTNANATVVYTVVAVSGAGCAGGARAITITIAPEPVVASGLNKTVCSDVAGGVVLNTNGTSVAAATYNITAVTVPGGLTVVSAAVIPASGVAANYLATDTYTNKGNASLDVLYTVVPVSAAGCLGDPLVVKQTVNPEPVLGNLNKTVCSDAAISLTLNTNGTSVAASTYNITLLNVAGGLTPAGSNVVIPAAGVSATFLSNDQFTNLGNLPLDVQYTVVPVSVVGCLGDPVIVVITINPEPVLSAALNKTVCSDVASAITLNTNGTSVAAANYNITSILVLGGLTPKAGNAAVGSGVNANYLAADVFTNKTNGSLTVTYTVIPVSAGGCLGDPVDVVLTVDPEPVMDPALATKTICSGAITNITLNTNGSSVAAATYNITLVSQDAGLTGVPTTGPGLLANAILNNTFSNVTTIPLKVVYQIVPVSAGGCLGDPFNITITVNPEPVINPALNNTVCSRDISGIILSTNGTSVAANSYQLVSVAVPGSITADPANVVPGSSSGINLIRNDKYTNTTPAAVVVTYMVFGVSPQGCQGQAQAILLTINPQPILSPGTANLCSDVPSGIILGPAGGSAPITQYQLKSILKAAALVAGPSNAGLGTYNTNNFLAGDQFTNTTNGPLQVTYTLAPITAAGCAGADQTVVFTVNPAPGLASNLNKTVCTNDVAGIVFATETSPLSAPAATYNILSVTIAAGLTQTAGVATARNGVTANEVQNDRFQNPGNTPLTVTYRVQGVTGALCVGPFKDIVLTVEPTIKAAPVNNKPTMCSNDLTDIDLISPTVPTSGPISFNYTAVSSVGGLISGFVPVASNLPANYKIVDNLVNNSNNPATVTYSITPLANGAKGGSGCMGTPVPVVVTVEPKPKLVATPLVKSVCEGAPAGIALTTTTVPGAGTIRFNVLSVVPAAGLTLTSPAVPVAFYTNGQSIADVWSNSDSTTLAVTYTLQPVINGGLGCVGDNVTITLNVNPLPNLTNTPQAPICSAEFVNIQIHSDVSNTINHWTAAVVSGSAYGFASSGAGDLIFQTIRDTTSLPATVRYTVTPTANGCAGVPLIIDVVVNPIPHAFVIPTTAKVCYGGVLNVPLSDPVAGTTFSWTVDPFPNSMGIDSSGSGPVINETLFNPTGAQDFLTYTITGTGPTSCGGAPKIMTVIAAPQMNAQFLNPAQNYLCKGSKDFLQIQLDGQAPFTLVYTDGTTNFSLSNVGNFKSIQITPLDTTTYTILSMKDAFQCPFSPVGQVTTFNVGETDATFSIVGPAASCSPYQVSLKYDQKAGTEYTWRWGDGVPDSIYVATTTVAGQVVLHTYTNTSPSSSLKPKITLQTDLPAPYPGCFKTTTKQIEIYPEIVANISSDKTEICSGELVRFTNQSFGATTHKWFYRVLGNIGQELDVQGSRNVNYVLTNTSASNPIIYEVVYQVLNGNCPPPPQTIQITVYRGVTASFDDGGIPPHYHELTGGHSIVNFTNTSLPVDPDFRYDWDFGLDATPATASTLNPPPVDYTSQGPRDVTLTVTNIAAETATLSCTSQFVMLVAISMPPLKVDIEVIPPVSCFPADITVIRNKSTGDRFLWKLYDENGSLASVSTDSLPVFHITNPGIYSLNFQTSDHLTLQSKDSTGMRFEIYARPLASFDLRPNTVFVPDMELSTFDFSTGSSGGPCVPCDYTWDFVGQGHFVDGYSENDRETKYVYEVEGKYDVQLVVSEDHGDMVCTDTLTRPVLARQGGLTKVPNAFTPNPNGPNDGTAGNGAFNDVFLPIVKGVEEFNMQIFDRWGNLIFESNRSDTGWNGYNKEGRLMPAGVYVYKLTVRLSDDQRSTQIGDITMIR